MAENPVTPRLEGVAVESTAQEEFTPRLTGIALETMEVQEPTPRLTGVALETEQRLSGGGAIVGGYKLLVSNGG